MLRGLQCRDRRRHQFHAVVRGMRGAADQFRFLRAAAQQGRPAAGAGIAETGAVSKYFHSGHDRPSSLRRYSSGSFGVISAAGAGYSQLRAGREGKPRRAMRGRDPMPARQRRPPGRAQAHHPLLADRLSDNGEKRGLIKTARPACADIRSRVRRKRSEAPRLSFGNARSSAGSSGRTASYRAFAVASLNPLQQAAQAAASASKRPSRSTVHATCAMARS